MSRKPTPETPPSIRSNPPLVLRRDEAAEYLQISVRTLDAQAANGSIRCARIGSRCLYPRAELDRFISVRLAIA
jgi:excisionase family DNA binding protein